MPGMQMPMGQLVPGIGPPILLGGHPGYPVYSDSYSSPNEPMWTYFAAVAGQASLTVTSSLRCFPPVCDWRLGLAAHLWVSGVQTLTVTDLVALCLTRRALPARTLLCSFSLETCRIMIAMLDRDCTGKMGFSEFKELWAVLSAWQLNFMTIDQDRSGTVEHHELSQAIAAMGYRLSPQTLSAVAKRYSKNGRIFFDDYVASCVQLRALTDFFRRRDHLQQGLVNFLYDDFLQGTMAI
ncbi:grancalcin [Echinops telfairi]|uniref:Grancalcin n=1 Tax=Echinops telfairi TaxID=9371 RepID=A0ABM0INA1_ECHTE|nr:grancalcin [Echinops telfairi]